MSHEINTIDRVTIKGVTYYFRDNSVIHGVPSGLPEVTVEDDGCILRVVNGRWELVQIATAEEGEY